MKDNMQQPAELEPVSLECAKKSLENLKTFVFQQNFPSEKLLTSLIDFSTHFAADVSSREKRYRQRKLFEFSWNKHVKL